MIVSIIIMGYNFISYVQGAWAPGVYYSQTSNYYASLGKAKMLSKLRYVDKIFEEERVSPG